MEMLSRVRLGGSEASDYVDSALPFPSIGTLATGIKPPGRGARNRSPGGEGVRAAPTAQAPEIHAHRTKVGPAIR